MIDINADVGEGIANEAQLFPYLSSCNIACGGHYGDQMSMETTVRLAIQHDVRIGAHPSYPDKANFGRKSMSMSAGELQKTIQDQIGHLIEIVSNNDGILHHIKPHGALYNDLSKDESLAESFIEVIGKYEDVILFVPPGSVIERLAIQANIPVWREAFADRNYNSDLTLVSRSLPRAVIEDADEVVQHLKTMVELQKVKTIDGAFVSIIADTFCIHGDNPNALDILKHVRTTIG